MKQKVTMRLRNGIGLIQLLLLGLGIYTVAASWSLSQSAIKLYEHPFTVNTAVLRIERNIHHIASILQMAEMEDDITRIDAHVQEIDALDRQMSADFIKINERFLGKKEDVRAAIALLEQWRPMREEILRKLKSGEHKTVRMELSSGAEFNHRKNVLVALDKFSDFAMNKAQTFYQESTNTRNLALVINIALVVGIVLISWLFLRGITTRLTTAVSALTSSSTEIAATISQQERIAAQQTSSVNETNTTMEELGASARQSSEQAESAAINNQRALDMANEGSLRVGEMLDGMQSTKQKVEDIARQILSLSEQTSQISDITSTVTDFANETKMLAMNAAVEAVRAGEHGKGFSVLSVEIRKLAEESKRSAERINMLVQEIQKATNTTVMVTEEGTKTVNEGMRLAQNTSDTFNGLADAVSGASESSQQISMNVRQQAVAIKQVVEAMKLINTGSKESSSGISQVKNGVQTLNGAAQDLSAMM
ncbi:methyl-accepting chemotaxis protein [Magnetofaba australis]|uniref:Putative methyl-accepting chemotaxis sensory transducer n=1 Tax=Magnetofaba australis IT-1 TaxID=1434232 RepID=A0A1Y2K650_9PROT|nr:methyl-accepting chemotaxis protein [Magnetofaba australis]OSM05141.1 putative methyl-accepting chemotaxis sensory transducer [Magnetofaba australis IT-1]